MTRARERLLLSGALDMHRWAAAGASAGPMAWIAPTLAPELPEAIATQLGPEYEMGPPGARLRVTVCTPHTFRTAPQAPPASAPAAPGRRQRRPRRRPRRRRPHHPARSATRRSASWSGAATATTCSGCWGSPT